MKRLYILLAVMVVMVGALFAGQNALAEVFTGTEARIPSWGRTGPTVAGALHNGVAILEGVHRQGPVR
jgi:hypothetical protein